MDNSGRKPFAHAFAEAALAVAGLEVTLLTLRESGVVTNAQVVEILIRLRGVIGAIDADPSTTAYDIVEMMHNRLRQMAQFLAVDLREN
ncbi:MAG: hypothetical protein MUE49_09215 [Rhodospirillales bacterium]|jgi:hypothetical protein|nr:hypothetical protein [Rhodospirillales bacterium]